MVDVTGEFFVEEMYTQCEQRASEQGCEELLSCFNRGVLGRMLKVQFRRTRGNIPKSVSNTISKLKGIELGVKALNEHHLRMDRGIFEMLVKSDSFLLRGRQKRTGYPLMWVRVGFPQLDGWKSGMRGDTPQAHSYISYMLHMYETMLARTIVEGLYAPTGGKERTCTIMDFVCQAHPITAVVRHITQSDIPALFLLNVSSFHHFGGCSARPTVNLKVTERLTQLTDNIFGPLEGAAVFAGVHSIARVILNCAKGIFPKSVTEGWIVLNRKEDIFDIVDDRRDIPHWWSESTEKTGAHRAPTDPREYWCWRRCLSDENPITVRDFYNPDPETWLDGCDTHADSGTQMALPGSVSMQLFGTGERLGRRNGMDGANMMNGKPQGQSSRLVSISALEVIEECDESDN